MKLGGLTVKYWQLDFFGQNVILGKKAPKYSKIAWRNMVKLKTKWQRQAKIIFDIAIEKVLLENNKNITVKGDSAEKLEWSLNTNAKKERYLGAETTQATYTNNSLKFKGICNVSMKIETHLVTVHLFIESSKVKLLMPCRQNQLF